MQKAETVFAFDFGKASLGEAVKVNDEIVHAASLLIPEDFASITEQRRRRRAYRTRLSHKEREEQLKKICAEAEIEVLRGRDQKNGIPGDKRLEKEFPSKNENICYTSCLLRVKLLRGEKLEAWQIYKALHSAIQRRGYDKDIPWKNSSAKNTDDEKDSENKSSLFQEEYKRMSPNPEYHYPCYYDAWKMGLWNPETNEFKNKIDCHAGRARGYTAPRKEVEKEIRALISNAALQFPYLKDKENYVLYGPDEKAYSSCKKVLGALGQKVPRFNNRMPDKCRLIPRLNVCSASDILAMQLTFLMKLKNMRLQRPEAQLSHLEIGTILNDAVKKFSEIKKDGDNPGTDKISKCFKITSSAWKKLCRKLKSEAIKDEDEVEPPKFSGRSSFSRPALRIMKELILSGKSPHSFHKEKIEEIEAGCLKGLEKKDLNFLLKMPDDWYKIHIPSQAFEAFQENSATNEEAVRKLIGSVGDPIVRHRLELFSKRLDILTSKFGPPEEIVMEFVRTDFMGPKALKKFEDFQKQRRARRTQASEMAASLGLSGPDAILKAELFIQQSGQDPYPMKSSQCIYTGACLEQSNIDSWHIDHIVPRRGKYHGSSSNLNLVLTTRSANTEKADRTPYEWLFGTEKWDAFTARVNSMKNMHWKKNE